jgi:hypothetical protein
MHFHHCNWHELQTLLQVAIEWLASNSPFHVAWLIRVPQGKTEAKRNIEARGELAASCRTRINLGILLQ